MKASINATKTIKCAEIQPGMILSKDFIVNNQTLLNKNVEISPRLAQKLLALFPQENLDIFSPENPNNSIYNDTIEARKKQIEKVFNSLVTVAEEIFNRINEKDQVEMDVIREASRDILDFSHHQGSLIKNVLEIREVDEYTYRHSVNTSILSVMLGRWLGFSERDLKLLCYSGILHDIGKAKIPHKILNKKSTLTSSEYKEMKKHPVIGYEIVKKIPFMDNRVALAVLMHHERIDGSGYPLKLKGNKITTFAKIIAIADTFDAMTSNRVYRGKLCPLDVLATLKEESFSTLDISFCNIFIENMLNYYIGDHVILSDGQLGTLVKIDINDIRHPLVVVNNTFYDLSVRKDLTIENIL